MSEKRKYCYSIDEERYHGDFDTREEAFAEGATEPSVGRVIWTAVCVPPRQPEMLWHAEDWLDHVSCQDDYLGDHAEAWDTSTKEQREELEREVRAVMVAWLDRHNLRPAFWNIDEIEEHTEAST